MGFFDKIFNNPPTNGPCVICNDKIKDVLDKYNFYFLKGMWRVYQEGESDLNEEWDYIELDGHFSGKRICRPCEVPFKLDMEDVNVKKARLVRKESKYYRKNITTGYVIRWEIINETNTDILFDYVSKHYKKKYEWVIAGQKKNEENQRQREKEAKEEEKKEQERKQRLNKKYGKKDADKILNGDIWIDMTKEMLIESWGNPEDEKENISRKKTKLKWYFGSRTTQHGTTAYKHEVRLENDIVEGWKELE